MMAFVIILIFGFWIISDLTDLVCIYLGEVGPTLWFLKKAP